MLPKLAHRFSRIYRVCMGTIRREALVLSSRPQLQSSAPRGSELCKMFPSSRLYCLKPYRETSPAVGPLEI